ncbi:hypothetical protein J1N35_005477 [Gossypium stocksii]|uniref:Reverse transcriptase Ty1/copia-type domain-containing protein n=1 Tax=Gossypium stocksii TaxID=47602 RepID=A0A9D3WEM5_9ROSI|nr:hypothetical protein J1N35_005477 [Gossypium stocksii]
MITRSKLGIFKPKAFLTKAACLSDDTPSDIHEVMKHECWQAAVHSELQALLQNNTWSLSPLPANHKVVLIIVYVDDIVITGSSNDEIGSIVRQLHSKFALKDMGQLNFFLGIEVQHTLQGVFLSQKKYILEILTKTAMLGAAATPTPMVNTSKLTASDGSPLFVDVQLYRSTVGMLQYLCLTRPQLSFCVNKLSQYMNLPIDHGLFFSKGRVEVVGYSDADWASSLEDRRSTTGYVVYLGPNPVAWCSKKQNVVSRSSSEAEYRSLANCVSELLWVKQLIAEIGLSACSTPVIWCDNTSAVSIAENPTHHARIKHVEIDHHFVREKVLDGTLQVNYVPSSKQIADVLTKPITPIYFDSFRQALRVITQNDVCKISINKEPREY